MVIYIYGEDTFRSRQYLREQVEKFKQTRDPQGFNTVFLDAKIEPSNRIIEEVLTTPFLAERRMVVVSNILSITDKEFAAALAKRLEEKKIPETNVVIFWQGETVGKSKEIKTLQEFLLKEKYVQKFEPLVGINLSRFVQKEFTDRGVAVDAVVVEKLIQHSGGDLWVLSGLVNQLSAYKPKEKITTDDVALFVSSTSDQNVFSLVEAIFSGNHRQAFSLLHGSDEDVFKLVGLLLWQLRILVQMRDCIDREDIVQSEVLAKKLGIHPFVVKKNLALVKKHTLTDFKKIYERLLDLDVKIKTGFAKPEILIDLLVARM
jgi:DNA polymerase-3 subunit delta